jgi:vancomycin resistance protein VanJ
VTVGGRSSWDAWLVSGAAGVAAARALHSAVPNGVGRLGSLLETFLPWLGVAVPVLGCLALPKRSRAGLLACLVPLAVWLPARARARTT